VARRVGAPFLVGLRSLGALIGLLRRDLGFLASLVELLFLLESRLRGSGGRGWGGAGLDLQLLAVDVGGRRVGVPGLAVPVGVLVELRKGRGSDGEDDGSED